MKYKYRIIKISYENLPHLNYYVAQYKVLGMWLNIKYNLIGTFFKLNAYCNTYDEALTRITNLKQSLERSKNYYDIIRITIVKDEFE